MHEIRIRTPAAWELLAALLMTLALLAKPMDARAAADDITVTMDAEIALTLDNSNPATQQPPAQSRWVVWTKVQNKQLKVASSG